MSVARTSRNVTKRLALAFLGKGVLCPSHINQKIPSKPLLSSTTISLLLPPSPPTRKNHNPTLAKNKRNIQSFVFCFAQVFFCDLKSSRFVQHPSTLSLSFFLDVRISSRRSKDSLKSPAFCIPPEISSLQAFAVYRITTTTPTVPPPLSTLRVDTIPRRTNHG